MFIRNGRLPLKRPYTRKRATSVKLSIVVIGPIVLLLKPFSQKPHERPGERNYFH